MVAVTELTPALKTRCRPTFLDGGKIAGVGAAGLSSVEVATEDDHAPRAHTAAAEGDRRTLAGTRPRLPTDHDLRPGHQAGAGRRVHRVRGGRAAQGDAAATRGGGGGERHSERPRIVRERRSSISRKTCGYRWRSRSAEWTPDGLRPTGSC